jgi:hypothetical protein
MPIDRVLLNRSATSGPMEVRFDRVPISEKGTTVRYHMDDVNPDQQLKEYSTAKGVERLRKNPEFKVYNRFETMDRMNAGRRRTSTKRTRVFWKTFGLRKPIITRWSAHTGRTVCRSKRTPRVKKSKQLTR